MAYRHAVLVESPGFDHLAGLSGLVDPNDAPGADDLLALSDALAYVLEAERALAPQGALEAERLALQDEARSDVPGGARQDAQGDVRDDVCGVWADVAEDARSPHQKSVPVDAQDALQEPCELAGTPAHGFLVEREVVVELYQTQEEEVSISWRPAEMVAPELL